MSRQGDGSAQATDPEATDPEATPTDAGGRPCPLCTRPMQHRHCKYVCPTHGVVYDCSDTFY
ncbi:hypothetical protein SAMN05192561_10452 [Halopenitus malekzadehii]|uniref:Small CPxCG-related zinc finger protein n=1 Tax=Halopenitus malekzadehii TaxID=1267564 RepID=A0A1H6IPU1_9EURY|nr:hypothetical protein SAMN05192561_10452 [Halopenitus malekzadehii]